MSTLISIFLIAMSWSSYFLDSVTLLTFSAVNLCPAMWYIDYIKDVFTLMLVIQLCTLARTQLSRAVSLRFSYAAEYWFTSDLPCQFFNPIPCWLWAHVHYQTSRVPAWKV